MHFQDGTLNLMSRIAKLLYCHYYLLKRSDEKAALIVNCYPENQAFKINRKVYVRYVFCATARFIILICRVNDLTIRLLICQITNAATGL